MTPIPYCGGILLWASIIVEFFESFDFNFLVEPGPYHEPAELDNLDPCITHEQNPLVALQGNFISHRLRLFCSTIRQGTPGQLWCILLNYSAPILSDSHLPQLLCCLSAASQQILL